MTQSYDSMLAGDSFSQSFQKIVNRDDTLRDHFSGATDPASISQSVPFQLWSDTGNDLLKIRNAADSAWIEVGTLSSIHLGLLSRDGTVAMQADLDFGTNKGINLVDPTAAQDAATKNYVDTNKNQADKQYLLCTPLGFAPGVITWTVVDNLPGGAEFTVSAAGVITINTAGRYEIHLRVRSNPPPALSGIDLRIPAAVTIKQVASSNVNFSNSDININWEQNFAALDTIDFFMNAGIILTGATEGTLIIRRTGT